MKVPITVAIQIGDDLRDATSVEIMTTISASQITAAIAEDRGLEAMHLLQASLNYNNFMKEIPQDTLDAMPEGQRKCIADALRGIASRFFPVNLVDAMSDALIGGPKA